MKATKEQAERAHRFAHDLRNRLAAIQQVLQQLRSGPDPNSGTDLIEFAEQQYFKAMRLTEEFMDDLEVERGVGQLQLSDVDLSELTRIAITRLQHRFDRKQQNVLASLEDNAVVRCDPHWIGELISALLGNASKFTPRGGKVSVTVGKQDGHAIVEVIDSGVGLSSADLNDIFTRYAWLESQSTDGEAQGRATLGRARQWADAHGGILSASSAGPGQGSAFVLRLPI